MWVGVVELVGVEHVSGFGEALGDEVVGFPDGHADEPVWCGGVVGAVSEDWAVDGEAYSQTCDVVIGAVTGCGVDETGAVFEGDIVGVDDFVACGGVGVWVCDWCGRVLDEWVGVGQPDEFVACGGRDGFDLFGFGEFGDALDGIDGHDGEVAIDADEGVGELLVDGDREVRGEGPGGGGPDHEARGCAGVVGFGDAEGVEDGGCVCGFKVHIHGEVFAVLVFKLGISEGGFVGDGPVDGFECFVDEALLAETSQHFENSGFVAREEGEVGVFVVRDGHESFHLTGLEFDLFVGVGFAFAADGGAALVVGESIEFGGFA